MSLLLPVHELIHLPLQPLSANKGISLVQFYKETFPIEMPFVQASTDKIIPLTRKITFW